MKFCYVAVIAMCMTLPVFAQETRATISGAITDSTGAAVPNVKVVATETRTGSTASSVSGFSGVAFLQPGERIAEHSHPYSEEFLFVAEGDATADLDGEPWELAAGAALLIPPGTRHRVRNTGAVPVRIVFHLGPLAPRPELGHVDTEDQDPAGRP